MLVFYYAPRTCALACHLALEQAGANYRAELVDFASGQQRSPEYLRINPKGRVPALITEQGVLTETPALLQYVAQRYPQSSLLPLEDLFLLARANEFNSYLCSTVHVANGHRTRAARWADDLAAQESMQRKAPQNMRDCFALIERYYLKGPWVLGEQFSACDYYLFTVSGWLEATGVRLAMFPAVEAHFRRLAGTAPVKRVLALHA